MKITVKDVNKLTVSKCAAGDVVQTISNSTDYFLVGCDLDSLINLNTCIIYKGHANTIIKHVFKAELTLTVE